MKRCVRIKVLGKVQGVFYRRFVQKNAEKIDIEGTIQNESDGGILVYACGLKEKLDDFIDILYKGSTQSKVSEVIVEPMSEKRDFRKVFRIIGGD
ncbi:acylphosphatase [Candidatus Babeliales bacterium]|nr:acylphosphatase [Candidatus Babeliales bacterium]